MTEPFVFLDQDMIVKGKLPDWTYDNDITIAHWEIGRGYYYFTKEKFENEITHVPWIKNYNVNDWSPNTSYLQFNNADIIKEYHEWHKKLVTTNGEEIPEWFWLLTDQGILGHIIRENDYKVNTLSQNIALAHHNNVNGDNRYKGKAEKWYKPLDTDDNRIEVDHHHVWLDKIEYNYKKEIYDEWSNYWFSELIRMGYSDNLHNEIFKKYWDEFNKNN